MLKINNNKVMFQSVELLTVYPDSSAYDDLILEDSIAKASNDLSDYFKTYKVLESKRVADNEVKIRLYSKKYDNEIVRNFYMIQDRNRFIINF